MKILIDGREFEKGKLTGIGRFLKNVLAMLAPARPGWEFILVLNQHGEFPDKYPNLKTAVIQERNTLFTDQFTLSRLIRRERAGLFYSPYYKCPVFANVPKIITIHDLTYFILESSPHFNNKPLLLWHRIIARGASKIITVSENSANDISRLLNVSRDKIKVLYNTVSDSFVPRPGVEISKTLANHSIRKPYIVYVGNSKPHKNLKRLIEAFSLLPEKMRNAYSLVLAGVDPSILDEYPDKSGFAAIPFIPDEDLPALYSGAELMVFPSLYEGFGIPPVEAMACGCPVASSNVSCMPEILDDACVYFNPLDINDMSEKIQLLLSDKNLREELSHNGRERAERYRLKASVPRVLGIFDAFGVKHE
ncbi:MAG: glycosyltransferase family 1 protein [Elusimicrobiota bacterium]